MNNSEFLPKITHLQFYSSEKIDEEKLFISKLTGLKNLIYYEGYTSLMNDFANLKTLERVSYYGASLMLRDNWDEIPPLFQCKSNIKSLTLHRCTEYNVLFNDVEWPLESFIITEDCELKFETLASLLRNELICKHLKTLDISMNVDSSILELFVNLESITELKYKSKQSIERNHLKYLENLVHLKKIELDRVNCGDEGVQTLSNLSNLEELSLNCNYITEISSLAMLRNLTILSLNDNYIRSKGAKVLTCLTELTELYLKRNFITDEGLQDFGQLKKLRVLVLSNNCIGNVGVNHLTDLTNLEKLVLNENGIQKEGFKNFGKLKKLKDLTLDYNIIGNGFKYLTDCTSLKVLYVRGCDIHDKAFVNFCKNGSNVKVLHVPDNYIFRNGCFDFIRNLPKLRQLEISHNQIPDSEFVKLAQLSNIKRLHADSCGITDKGFIDYMKSYSKYPKRHAIESISLQINNITNESLKELIQFSSNIKLKDVAITLFEDSNAEYRKILFKQIGYFCHGQYHIQRLLDSFCFGFGIYHDEW